MKERPILFSGPMVRAILSGTKSQTRRIVKPQPMPDVEFVREHEPEVYGPGAFCAFRQDGRVLMHQRMAPCPYGQPGDRLWVRETWAPFDDLAVKQRRKDLVFYRADDAKCYETDGKWRPSIFMPRWASRLTLEITGVRVERLHDISEADAQAEGIERVGGEFSCSPWRNYRIGKPGEMSCHCSAKARSYMTLWESINGAGSWGANPWVWVIEFSRVTQ